jgi:hypothetical protein
MSMSVSGTYVATSAQVEPSVLAIGGSIFEPLITLNSVAGTWAESHDATYRFCTKWDNAATHAQNDEFTFTTYLPAGTYTVRILAITNNNCAIATIKVDGGAFGTIDTYTAGLAYNVVLNATGCINTTSGIKTISFKCATKHASSSNYYLTVGVIQFIRTA